MKDRIQINGVWYVREAEAEPIVVDYTEYTAISYENDNYHWIANILSTDGKLSKELWIEFLNKENRQEDIWDNPTWILGVYNNNPESIKEIAGLMTVDGIKHFQAFIKILIDKNWL